MGYNINDTIKGSDANFETLRVNLDNFINNSNRQNPIGTQAISRIGRLSSSVSSTEKYDSSISANPFSTILNKIYNIVQSQYMATGTGTNATARTSINNIGERNKGDIIPSLNNYYTIVNFWAGGTDNNLGNCNGACSGFCQGTCYGAAKGLGKINQDTEAQYCTNNSCTNSCHHQCYDNCSRSCQNVCEGMCETQGNGPGCDACTGSCSACAGNCGNGCSTCSSACERECSGNCATQCQGCKTVCGYQCNDSCSEGCGSGCQGNCTISANSHA